MNQLETQINISSDVQEALNTYLTLVDHYLPQKITGLYLVGSIALNDYHPGKSDIDLVAVSDDHCSDEELNIVSQIHTTISTINKYPRFDGIYVTFHDLQLPPENTSAPYYLGNTFKKTQGFAANPVTWSMLTKYPLAIRGPEKPTVYSNDRELRNWCQANLDTYWKSWIKNAKSHPIKMLYSLSPTAITWGVLGIIRLHATIRTGDIISKSKAAEYAFQTFPKEWEEIIHVALSARRTNTNRKGFDPFTQRKRALAFMEYVMRDAHTITNTIMGQ